MMGLIHYDNIPLGWRKIPERTVAAFNEIHGCDHTRFDRPRIRANFELLSRFVQIVTIEYRELKPELGSKLLLPLIHDACRANDKHTARSSPGAQILQNQTSFNRLAEADIIR